MQLQEYAVNTDCAHIREDVDADENLTHINHTQIFAKDGLISGQKWVKKSIS